MRYFTSSCAAEVNREHGSARVVTAANFFAHIEDVHSIVQGILDLLAPDGVFISESHYLIGLMDRLQYDTIYNEHLRYYSLSSLSNLFSIDVLEAFHTYAIAPLASQSHVCFALKAVMPGTY